MDHSGFRKNNQKNFVISSKVPDVTKEKPCWLGIDEAGRGPVLGPMVYGTCYSPLEEKDHLKHLGLADSKTLTEEKRESILGKMTTDSVDKIGWMVHILSPTFISNSMLKRTKYNLNALSHDSAIGLITKVLALGVNVTEIYVDTVGDATKYQQKLEKQFPGIDITVAKKADSTYSIVSGASIFAKVARDRILKDWDFVEGIDVSAAECGSGYPNDPLTKKFLRHHMDKVFGFPQIVRFSWSTASSILDKDAALVEWEDDDEADDKENPGAGSASLLTFFSSKADKGLKHKRHRFFTERNLYSVSQI
ncbi:ribonuclease H2 subunit A [Octopus sinensis]|uniref:Ribonuclease n=1 Tax=Octopus sinensis TaxID=2607531 RepID=A0A6P7TVL5_9MOLL|nr:ribonuclease H2 subunit A [Octopus sinensis]